jgi:hypothetical protein
MKPDLVDPKTCSSVEALVYIGVPVSMAAYERKKVMTDRLKAFETKRLTTENPQNFRRKQAVHSKFNFEPLVDVDSYEHDDVPTASRVF